MSDNLPPKEAKCHCTGFTKSCRALVTSGACRRWRDLKGMDPQTGENKVLWDCIDNHAHILRLDIGKATAEAGASIDSHRNQMIKIGRRQIVQRDEALKRLPGATQ